MTVDSLEWDSSRSKSIIRFIHLSFAILKAVGFGGYQRIRALNAIPLPTAAHIGKFFNKQQPITGIAPPLLTDLKTSYDIYCEQHQIPLDLKKIAAQELQLSFDAMYVKKQLLFNKSTGEIVGSSFDTSSLDFRNSSLISTVHGKVAKEVILLVVRSSVLCDFKFPLAYYPIAISNAKNIKLILNNVFVSKYI